MVAARPARLPLLVLLVLGVLLAGMLPASAATSRSLSIKVTTGTPTVGSTITVSGTLSRSAKGAPVTVQRLSGTRWVTAKATRTTTTKGTWSAKVAVSSKAGSQKLRAVAKAVENRKAATSRSVTLDVRRKVTVTATATPSRVTVGDPVTVSGTASPFVSGTTVTIQTGRGTKVTTTTIGRDGSYTATVTPTTSGTSTYRVVVAGRTGYATATSPTRTVTVEATPVQPVITTTTLKRGRTGVAYSDRLTTAGEQPGAWSVSPALPSGLALDPRTGAITGTPTTAGQVTTTVTFTHDNGKVATTSLTLSVDESPRITTTSLPTALDGAPYDETLSATQAGTWSRVSGSLPPGLRLTPQGRVSGTPTSRDASSTFTVRFTSDASGLTAERTYVVESRRVIASTQIPVGQVGVPYRHQLRTNAPANGTWGTLGGLPAGITLDPQTGVLSGTPQQSTFFVVVTFTLPGASEAVDEANVFEEFEDAMPVTASRSTVSAGRSGACRVSAEDGGAAACWGTNYSGHLGIGSVSVAEQVRDRATPLAVRGPWRVIDNGDVWNTCGIQTDDSLWCWGRSTVERGVAPDSPRRTFGTTRWDSVTLGFGHGCGIKTDDTLWCWGDNGSLQLGQQTPDSAPTSSPLQLGTDTWRSVAASYARTCAVRSDSSLWCWGDDTLPAPVSGSWSSVGISGSNTCGIRTDDTLWCWGPNASGQLGTGTTRASTSPVQVGQDRDWRQVSLRGDNGTTSACAVRVDGTLWCWGANDSGQLGNGTTDRSLVPTRVDQTRSWSGVEVGVGFACGVKNDGSQRCWGRNDARELGNGRAAGSVFPTKVED